MSGNRLYRQVVDQISELIESGEYTAGSRLPPERELAERFNVSRPTIREAVIALEAVGRISVKTGSGMYVNAARSGSTISGYISPFELIEARVLVEGEAAALAASMITPDQIKELEDVLQIMSQENSEEGLGPNCADRRFHSIIAKATNNKMMASMIENLWDTQKSLGHINKAHQSICAPDPEVRLNEHRAIIEALARGDAQDARTSMRKHFARAIEALHITAEKEAVEEVQRRLSQTRERFSSDRIIDRSRDATLGS